MSRQINLTMKIEVIQVIQEINYQVEKAAQAALQLNNWLDTVGNLTYACNQLAHILKKTENLSNWLHAVCRRNQDAKGGTQPIQYTQ